MDKKKISGIVLICVLGVIVIIFLYLIRFFDGIDILSKPTNNNPITTVSENTSKSGGNNVTETGIKTEEVKETEKNEKTDETEKTEANKTTESVTAAGYKFRNKNLLNQHYEKHGISMGFSSAEVYEKAASAVINNPNALHKVEAEDGDDVYYLEATNEFEVVSTDGLYKNLFFAGPWYRLF